MHIPCKRIAILVAFVIALAGPHSFAAKKTSISWSRKEQAEIERLAGQVKMVNGMNQIENSNWITRTAYGPQFTAEASYFMEMFSEGLLSVFLSRPKCSVDEKPVLVIHSSKEAYANEPKVNPNARGICRYGYSTRNGKTEWDIRLYTYFESHDPRSDPEFGECYLDIIQHEGTHALLVRIFGRKPVPTWLHEGFATFYEDMDLRSTYKLSSSSSSILDRRARRERTSNSRGPDVLKDYLRKHREADMGLAYLTGLTDNAKWDVDQMGPKTSFHYALAESFVDFLMASQYGRLQLTGIMDRLHTGGEPPIPAQESGKIESAWHQYLARTWRVRLPRK